MTTDPRTWNYLPGSRTILRGSGIALLAFLLLAIPNVAAQSTTFTSTSDFDAGTKTGFDGNFAVETASDNPGIAAGQLELLSMKGDSFGVADADLNTFKWNPFSTGSSTINTFAISSGEARVNFTQVGFGVRTRGFEGPVNFSGDFDVRVKVQFVFGTGVFTKVIRFSVFAGSPTACSVVNFFSLLYTWSIPANTILATKCEGLAGGTNIGTASAIPANPFWWRINRTIASNVVTWSTSTDGITYTTDETSTFATGTNSFFPHLALQTGGTGNTASATFDDYRLASGTLNASGFHTSGSWTSANQTATSTPFSEITVDYSGATVGRFITAVSLLNSTGATLFVDDTDRTSGTTVTISVPNLVISGPWRVRVNLTGDGSGTVAVASVSIGACVFSQELWPTLVIVLPILIGVFVVGLIALFFYGEELHTTFSRPASVVALTVGIIIVLAVATVGIPAILEAISCP